jgi:selenocysteine lyase/cysteine desulfurase
MRPKDAVEMQEERIWTELRREFPVAKKYIYLNHAAVSPIPRKSAEAIARCAQEFCEKGIVCNHDYLQLVEDTRKLAARLVGVSAQEIAFVKNTTQGILLAANGINWRKGDNVIIPEKEFPANVYPWLNLIPRGVEVRFVRYRNGRFTAEDIERLVDSRTRAISVSAVAFGSGFRCNLGEIGRLCKENKILFVVDGIQALGAIDVNVIESCVDVLCADAHKWLLGPQGIGILYVSQGALEKLEVSNLGWKSMEGEGDYSDYTIRLKAGAPRFEEGTLNIMGIAGLKASLEIILSIGVPKIEERILYLCDLISEGLTRKSCQLRSPMEPGERSGILNFTRDKVIPQDIMTKLRDAGVVCALREGGIRVSPHFYNNGADIEGLLKAL